MEFRYQKASVAVLLVGGLIASVFALTSLLRPNIRLDYPLYDSIEDLAANSDLIVSGVIVGVVGDFVDRGGDPEVDELGDPIPGIPMIVYSFEVAKSSSDRVRPGDTLPVLWVDLARADVEGLSSLREGEPMVLYLERVSAADAPDIASVSDVVWGPLSGDNGVMDIENGLAVSRSQEANLEEQKVDSLFPSS